MPFNDSKTGILRSRWPNEDANSSDADRNDLHCVPSASNEALDIPHRITVAVVAVSFGMSDSKLIELMATKTPSQMSLKVLNL